MKKVSRMRNAEDTAQEFVLYRVRVLFPTDWRVQCNPVLRPEHGSFDLFEPSRRREAAVTVLWRPAENVKPHEDRPAELAARLRDHREKVVTGLGRSLKGVVVFSSQDLQWCGHPAVEDRMTAIYRRGILRQGIRLVRVQRILLCTETDRLLSVYGSCLEEQLDRWEQVFSSVFDSFHCHHPCSE